MDFCVTQSNDVQFAPEKTTWLMTLTGSALCPEFDFITSNGTDLEKFDKSQKLGFL